MDWRPDGHRWREGRANGGPGLGRQAPGSAGERPRGRRPARGTRVDARDVEPGAREPPNRPIRSGPLHRGDGEPLEAAPDGDREAEGARAGYRAHQIAATQVRQLARCEEAARPGGEGPAVT